MSKTSPFHLYPYIGPPHFLEQIEETPRFLIRSRADLQSWRAHRRGEWDGEGFAIATYVITAEGFLWIADRRSEHVRCARGGRVWAAGEIFLGQAPLVERITNQSTGYCPASRCWSAVEFVLGELGVPVPEEGFRPAFEFRRCTSCSEVQLVKDSFFYCVLCSEPLNPEWNVR